MSLRKKLTELQKVAAEQVMIIRNSRNGKELQQRREDYVEVLTCLQREKLLNEKLKKKLARLQETNEELKAELKEKDECIALLTKKVEKLEAV